MNQLPYDEFRIIALVDRRHPCTHSFLDGVVEKRLTQSGTSVTWIMRSAVRAISLRRACWRTSDVILLPSLPGLPFGRLLIEHALFLAMWPLLLWQCRSIRPHALFVRNDPLYLLFGKVAGFLCGARVIFQLSHLKEEDLLQRAQKHAGIKKMLSVTKAVAARTVRDALISGTSGLLVISDAMHRVLLSYRRKLPPVMVMPLGVDVGMEAEAHGSSVEIAYEEYVIYVGTLAETRRPETMIHAFAKTAAAHPDLGLLLVGGGGEPKARDRLKSYVRSAYPNLKVQFVADVPRAQLAPLIKGAVCGLSVMPAAGVNLTISPTKLMEYMQFACPVIGSRGIPEQDEIMQASCGGLLVDYDEDSIAAAMEYMLSNSEERSAMGRRGQRYILTHRNYDAMAEQLQRFLVAITTELDCATGTHRR